MRVIEGRLESDLLRLTKLRAPQEAVGLILSDGSIVELTNHSSTPESAFEVHRSQIIDALGGELNPSAVIFWHSHPSGGVGPSRTDMRNRTLFSGHLVVSLVDGDLIASWY